MKQKLITFLLAIVAMLGGGYAATNFGGSIADGNFATTTPEWNIGVTATAAGNFSKLIRNGSGALDAIVVTTETAGVIDFYDATSTNHGHHATTTLFRVPASMAEGAYELNIPFYRGLLAVYSSSNVASTTILYK